MNGHKYGISLPTVINMNPYQTVMGTTTTKDDPNRLCWYGPCMYWTDNWRRLGSSISQIPCCPICGAVGFQITYAEWMEGAIRFAAETDQPGYPKWLQDIKEVCSPEMSMWRKREQKEPSE